MKLRTMLKGWDPLLERRNVTTGVVLYGVLVMAVLFSLFSTFDIVFRFVEFVGSPIKYWLDEGSEDTFFTWLCYNYGKGWIPGWLIGIAVGICNYRLIRGCRDGAAWMLVSFFVICFPLIFFELEEFIYFSFSAIVAMVVYVAFLFFQRKGRAYWSVCKASSNWVRIIAVVIAVVWVFMLISACRCFELYGGYSCL